MNWKDVWDIVMKNKVELISLSRTWLAHYPKESATNFRDQIRKSVPECEWVYEKIKHLRFRLNYGDRGIFQVTMFKDKVEVLQIA